MPTKKMDQESFFTMLESVGTGIADIKTLLSKKGDTPGLEDRLAKLESDFGQLSKAKTTEGKSFMDWLFGNGE